MKTTHRPCAETAGDFNRLCRLIVAEEPHIRAFSTWCLGRLVDWKYGLYDHRTAVPDFCDRNAHLWFDGFDELAGFAISEEGDSGFAIITAGGYRFLYEEFLAWVLENWQGRDADFSTEVTQNQTFEIDLLERRGFQRDSTFYTRRFELTREPEKQFPLEEGFTIVDMEAHPDYRAQRLLRDDAFGDQSDTSEEELERRLLFYNHIHAGPIYHPRFDLCVMAPDGRLVAGCEALIDARNQSVDIERICTHSQFRRRGFARAVIRECMVRLSRVGIRTAYICGYSPEALALYGSLGHTAEKKSFLYTRPAA